jgi:putative membrane protein
MNYLLHHQPVYTWSLFFGLIAASIFVVGKTVEQWKPVTVVWFAIGVGFATLIVNMIPVSTPETHLFIFFSGLIAICAMILPGISGAFILLILGKYQFITACLKNPFLLTNMVVIIVFCAGCLVGLLGFSRVLSFLLKKYHAFTLSFLTGLMVGSMQKIWPWKEVTATKIIRGKLHVLADRNILPASLDGEVLAAVGLMVAGGIAVLALEWFSREKTAAG